jgi:CRISPR-associated endonuclease/helicase Cas3
MIERFDSFFAAVNNGQAPYPWQCELVERIARDGRWPEAISMPTGSGKSSVVDVHVFLVAERARRRQAGETGIARPPRRLVLVAPRRALVEDQFERATRLAALLADPPDDPVVAEVAEALNSLCSADDEDRASPLGVARLRGGVRLDLSWRLDPTQCQIICATPQMWGSRLLLRGFRGSRRARNLESGLLGHDAAVVIDEAHLNERLVATARRVAENGAGSLGVQVVAMSATRGAPDAVQLKERDLEDERLAKRVRATKRITMVRVADWRRDAPVALAEQAKRLAGAGTVGVFVNTVAMALDVAGRLDGTVEVVCGRMRPADVDRLRDSRPGLLDARGNADVDFLVSTQSLEVGVDLDLPAVVSALAPASALAQRAGRLNRSGKRDDAEFVVVAPSELDESEIDRSFAPYTARSIIDAARWLEQLDGDASPDRINATPLPVDPQIPVPTLTRVELETFAMAGVELAADAEADFYISEPLTREPATVSIAARDYLDYPESVVRDVLLAAPPRAHELADMALGRQLGLVLNAASGAWRIHTDNGERAAAPLKSAEELKPGDVVVVPAGSKIMTGNVIGLVGRSAGEQITDVMAERRDGPPDAVIPLDIKDVEPIRADDATLSGRAARRALADLVAVTAPDVARRLRGRLSDVDVRWCADPSVDEKRGLLVVVSTAKEGVLPRGAVRGTELVALDAHCDAVSRRLEEILDRLDADPSDLGATRAQLLDAGRLHDAGKVHPRFQARMGADGSGPPVAKPVPGHRADRGDGWRHEQLSAAVAWAESERDPIPTVLVASHHGHGMPLFDRSPEAVLDGWDGCDARVEDALKELFGPCGRYELERARLERALGLHRSLHLQALLRCADMQVSREGS